MQLISNKLELSSYARECGFVISTAVYCENDTEAYFTHNITLPAYFLEDGEIYDVNNDSEVFLD